MAFSLESLLVASGSDDGSTRIRDLENGDAVAIIENHSDSVCSVALSPECQQGKSGPSDGTIMVWDVKTGKAIGDPFEGHTSYVDPVAFSADRERII